MTRKSDRPRARKRVTATEASRSFAALLDQVEAGHQFTVRRHGRDVADLVPPQGASRRASACLEVLAEREAVRLDDRFAADLLAIVAGEVPGDPPWGS